MNLNKNSSEDIKLEGKDFELVEIANVVGGFNY
jgi:hypothetical protein